MIVTADIKINATAVEQYTAGIASGSLQSAVAYALSLANGSGSGLINKYWSHSGTLAVSTPVTWTLSALTDDQGRAVAFTKVRFAIIVNADTVDSHTLKVGGAASHPWAAPFDDVSDKLKVYAGGVGFLVAPLLTAMSVTSGSSDQLKLDPGAVAVPYQILIAGE